nr:hypothetical protein B0A51_11090 [Rachicladosporium sp. CCFEE 5018]
MDQACYVHGSLYRFTPTAARTIIKHFTDGAARVVADRTSWDLVHDGHNQIFALICHSTHGFALDELLRDVTDRYVAQELDDASEEDRQPQVELFGESALNETFDDDAIPTVSDEPLEVGGPPVPLSSHVVQRDGMKSREKVAAMQLSQLPIQLRARFSGVLPDSSTKNLTTVRASQWDGQQGPYCYSGEIGTALSPLSGQEHMDLTALLDELTPFSPLERLTDIRKEAQIPLDAASPPIERHWEFVGEQPRTNQWLVGMGETTELLSPDAAPVPSKDAIRYQQIATQAQETSGRIRMPQGVSSMPSQGENVDDEPEQTMEQLHSAFTALMKRPAVSDEASNESAAETDSDAGSGGVGIAGQTGWAKLLGNGQKSVDDRVRQANEQSSALTCIVPQVIISDSESTADTVPQGSGPPTSSHETPATVEDSFPTYERRYAQVDGIGLMGDAANQAKWELENRHPAASVSTSRPLRTKDQVMLARQACAVPEANPREPSTLASLKHMNGNADRKAASSLATLTPATYADTKLGGSESWADKVVPAQVAQRTGHLIDTSYVADAFRATPEQFPALTSRISPSMRLPVKQAKTAHEPQAWQREQGNSGQPGYAHAEGLLIDVSASTTTNENTSTSTVKLPKHKALPPKMLKIVDCERGPHKQRRDDDTVIERLQPDTDEPPKRRSTMKQKAQNKAKKGKGSKSKASKPALKGKAMLELPDPPPMPKAKRVPELVPLQAASIKQKADICDVDRDDAQQGIFTERVLKLLLTQDGEAAPALVVQFGIVLLHRQDTETVVQAVAVADMQRQLDAGNDATVLVDPRAQAKFLTRLCTAHQDAAHLLSLPCMLSHQRDGDPRSFMDAWCAQAPFDLRSEILYEVEVMDIDKVRWLIVVCPKDDRDVDVSYIPQEPSKMCVHYPHHVWDARIQLRRKGGPTPTAEILQAAKTFAKTFNSLGELTGLPAIEADVPDIGELPAFTVQRVVAKRRFSQAIPLKSSNMSTDMGPDTCADQKILATWHVDQSWNLILNINDALDGEAGLLAAAGTEAEMLERDRLWWEASLELNDGLCKTATTADSEHQMQTLGAFERTLGEIMGECGLDNVGLGEYYGMDLEELAEVLQPAVPAKTKGRTRRGTGRGKIRAAIEEDVGYTPFW